MAKIDNVSCIEYLIVFRLTISVSYDTSRPPRFIRLWLDEAPTVLLVIAATTFIIGLNLFVYLSVQVRLPRLLHPRLFSVFTVRQDTYQYQQTLSRAYKVCSCWS